MNNSHDPLDKLISETLQDIHGQALHDPLANSFHSLDNDTINRAGVTQTKRRKRYQTNSIFAVAASILLIVGLGIPALISSQNDSNSESAERIRTATERTATSTTSPSLSNGESTTTNPLSVDPENIPTTTIKKSFTSNTNPFSSPTSPVTPTSPAIVDQFVRISYSNTRANDIPLDGATISGNVYIFIPDLDAAGAIWWLDQPGVWDKNLKTRSGTKKPIDFNYRVQPEAIVPIPFDTSTLSEGEHTMGVESQSVSTGKYRRITIKFYVTR